MAELQVINIGTSPNDGEGDPLRTAFAKVNNNFANLWSTSFNTQESITFGNAMQSIFEWPVSTFTQATFQINSVDGDSTDSQNVVINASLNGALDSVRFTAHSTTFHGNAVTNYQMDVVDSAVVLYVTPFVQGQMSHFISYQITHNPLVNGQMLGTEQNVGVLGTESTNGIITTEG